MKVNGESKATDPQIVKRYTVGKQSSDMAWPKCVPYK